MRTFDVPLQEVYMTAYLQEKMPADPEEYRLPAIVVYPGGGYRHLSPREAERSRWNLQRLDIRYLCCITAWPLRDIQPRFWMAPGRLLPYGNMRKSGAWIQRVSLSAAFLPADTRQLY